MENKATSEILDLLWKLEKKSEKSGEGLPDEYDEAIAELRKRPPYDRIIGDRQNEGYDPSMEELLKDATGDIKLLKRHKHDDKSNDVLIRI